MILPAFLRKPKPAPTEDTPREGYTSNALIEEVNVLRRKAGLLDVLAHPAATRAAIRHAQTMAAHRKVTHRVPGEADEASRLREAGYEFADAREFVGTNAASAAEMLAKWTRAHGNRSVLKDYDDAGSAVAKGIDGKWYWCLIMGKAKYKGKGKGGKGK